MMPEIFTSFVFHKKILFKKHYFQKINDSFYVCALLAVSGCAHMFGDKRFQYIKALGLKQ